MIAAGLARLLAVLERLGIGYYVCGSVASSVHGLPRTTMDVDLVVALTPELVPAFARELKGEFYADPEMMREALAAGRAFNLIHFASSLKLDIFPLAGDAFAGAQFARRRTALYEALQFPIASPEDTILSKLVWYRAGGEVSERQWNDVRGIVAVQGGQLDMAYLRDWAPRLGVADLLDRLQIPNRI